MQVDAISKGSLLPDDVMILDTTYELIVWIGQAVSAYDRDMAIEYAIRLNAALSLADGRDANQNIIRMDANGERLYFTRYFDDWAGVKNKLVSDIDVQYLCETRHQAWRAANREQKEPALATVELKSHELTEPTTDIEIAKANNRKSMAPNAIQLDQFDELFESLSLEQSLQPVQRPESASIKRPAHIRNPNDPIYTRAELKDMKVGINVAAKEYYLCDEEFMELFKQDRESFYNMPLWKQQMEKKKYQLF